MAVTVEKLRFEDLEKASDLIHKFWELSSEFEPTLEIDESSLEKIRENMKMDIADKRKIVLLAKDGQRVIGVIRVEIRDNFLYGEKLIGCVMELYVVPAYRKLGVAVGLLNNACEILRAQDVELLMAEFLTENVLAASFYEKNSFVPFISTYARKVKP